MEDDYSRLAPLYMIFAWVVSPIFTILTYNSELSREYVYASISFTIGLSIYVLVATFIRTLRNTLLYFFLFHLYATSFYLFGNLIIGGFKTLDVFSFLAIYALFSLAIQRFYALLIYNVLIISLMIYALNSFESAEISNTVILAFFLLIALSSTYMIYSRQLLLNDVEDYSKYLKDILDDAATGFILLDANSDLDVIDINLELKKAVFNDISKRKIKEKLKEWFSDQELEEIRNLRLGNKITKRIEVNVYNRATVYDINITRQPLKNGDGILFRFNDNTSLVRKKQESELNERRYRNLFLKNRAGVFVINDRSKVIDANPAFFEMMEHSVKINDQLFQDQREWDIIKDIINSKGELKNYQTGLTLKNGSHKSLIFNLFNDESQTNIEGSVVDLTTYEDAVSALKQSEEKYRLIFESSNDAIVLLDGQKVVNANKKAIELFSGIVGGRLFNYSADQTLESEKRYVAFKSKLSDKKSVHFDWLFKSGERILETEVFISEVLLEGQVFHQYVIHDQTEVKSLARETVRAELAEETNRRLEKEIIQKEKAEKKLKEQYLRTRAIFESSSNTFLLTLDLNGKILSFNTQFRDYFEHLSNIQLKNGDDFESAISNFLKEEEIKIFKYLIAKVYKGKQRQFELSINVNGMVYWLEIYLSPIYDVNEKVIEVSLVAHDITEKQLATQEIKESLQEKEILLKEIHHRVKNNMQVISSILNLQSSYVQDENTLRILQESRNRIRSMAMIHESLYRRDDFSTIDFSGYIENLVYNLISSYTIGQKVKIEKDLKSVSIDLDQAIPCGLLVNEVITNALKYAWEPEENGTIFISLKKEGNFIIIEIADDGKGLPQDFELIKSDTLGLQLIITLVEQLDGELKVDITKGTKYLIKFEDIKPNSHVED